MPLHLHDSGRPFRSRLLALTGGLAVLAAPLGAAPAYDFSSVTAILQQAHADLALRGSGLRVMIHGEPVYEQFLGAYDAATIVPIASATKTLSAAVIMALVDDGALSLEDKVSKFIPSFNKPGGYADITIRQCFAHTSGLPGQEEDSPALSGATSTLEQAADLIARYPMIGPPGGQFSYGGLSMQVAGRCAEIAAGRSWDQLFREKIALPLGLTRVDFDTIAFLPPYRPVGNPRIGGGARCSLRDYSTFMQMLLNRGVHQGRRVLSEGAVREMERNQIAGLPIVHSPWPELPYGLGIWVDGPGAIDVSGETIRSIAGGALGFAGWVDHARGISAAFIVLDEFRNVEPYLRQIQAALRTIVDDTPPSAGDLAARLVNLSARTTAGAGEATLIAGFALAGGPRDLLVRGIGPGLAAHGVAAIAPDPVLTLFRGASPIAGNDNWSGDDGRALGAFALATGSADAVLAAPALAPDTYTAQVAPRIETAAGEALAEIYDAGGGAGRLVNLSARSALAGDARLIAGFVISGAAGARKNVLVRAAGPALVPLGVAGAMTDPQLELYAGSTLIAANDNWAGESSLATAFASVGAFDFGGFGAKDAALVVSLAPGIYTAHVSGKAGDSGVVLVEVYELH